MPKRTRRVIRGLGGDVSGRRFRGRIAVAAAAVIALGIPAAASALPTAAELDRATDRFLERHGAAAQLRLGSGGSPAVTEVAAPADLPSNRVVALYGAPQMGATILGSRSPRGAASKLATQSAPYERLGDRPVLGAFDLVSVFATAGGGSDGLYRSYQDPAVIQIYLDQARAAGARLILDVQPARSTFLDELEVLTPWLLQPDVDLALDPEWNVGPRGVPGQTQGKVSAGQVNRVARALAEIVEANELPSKLLLVHQFRKGSIRGRSSSSSPPGVQTVLNFDGIGSPDPKAAGYAALAPPPKLFSGFSLFYRRDTPLMKPGSVLAPRTRTGLPPLPVAVASPRCTRIGGGDLVGRRCSRSPGSVRSSCSSSSRRSSVSDRSPTKS